MVSACDVFSSDGSQDAAKAASLLQQNRIAEARIAIDRAIKADDDVPDYFLLKGQIEYRAKAYSGAFAAFSNAASLDPSNQQALEGVFQLGLQTGDLRDSLEATKSALALNPNNKNALLVSGLLAIVRKKTVEADGFANRILAIDPTDEGGVILKARAAFFNGQPQQAIHALDVYSANRPDTEGIALTRLEIYRALRNPGEMEKQFAILRTLQPDNLAQRIDEANLKFKIGREVEGLALTAQVLADAKLPPPAVSSAIALWREYPAAKLPAEAVAAIAAGGSPAARLGTAQYLVSQQRYPEAQTVLKGLTGNDAVVGQAEIAMHSGNAAGAGAMLDAALAKDPTHCRALALKAELLLNANQNPQASRLAQQAAAECPGLIEAWQTAALAYDKGGDATNARRMFRQGTEAVPQDSAMSGSFVAWLLARNAGREALSAARRLTRNAPALLSGWRLYADTCRKADPGCGAEASAGLNNAKTLYGIDLLTGETAPNGLFGRIVIN